MKITNTFPTGDIGWGLSVTIGSGLVEAAITGPVSGHYNGDWMTPEEAEAIGVGFIQAAQAAREKFAKKAPVAV
jgi:hypothetical protein